MNNRMRACGFCKGCGVIIVSNYSDSDADNYTTLNAVCPGCNGAGSVQYVQPVAVRRFRYEASTLPDQSDTESLLATMSVIASNGGRFVCFLRDGKGLFEYEEAAT